jgi:hypothetical protein
VTNLIKPGEAPEVADVIRRLLAAMSKLDRSTFRSLVTPGFYCFDIGKRYDADGLMEMFGTAQHDGKKFVWSVTEPDVHIHVDCAWISYINVGSIQTSADTYPTPTSWLESAFLQHSNEGWKVAFFHSVRAVSDKS